ncbi:MAG: hypothetical protein ACXAD7_09995 [Candidatus Kariarchaeaceae archaeon]
MVPARAKPPSAVRTRERASSSPVPPYVLFHVISGASCALIDRGSINKIKQAIIHFNNLLAFIISILFTFLDYLPLIDRFGYIKRIRSN